MSEAERESDSGTVEKELYSQHPTMFRNHPLAFAMCTLVMVAGIAGVPWSLWIVEEQAQGLAIGAGVLAGIAAIVFIRWWFRTLATTLTVTNQHTVLRRGLLSKHINEISHANVRNVQIQQSFIQRVLSTGTVQIASAGQSRVEIEVEGLPHPEKIREIINKARANS